MENGNTELHTQSNTLRLPQEPTEEFKARLKHMNQCRNRHIDKIRFQGDFEALIQKPRR